MLAKVERRKSVLNYARYDKDELFNWDINLDEKKDKSIENKKYNEKQFAFIK